MDNSLYIIFTGTIVRMGGAQMYISNKVKYMKSLGWDVVVFSGLKGEIVLRNLKEYGNLINPKLEYYPNLFSQKERTEIIEGILTIIRKRDRSNVVIESSTGHMAIWAELVADRINAHHFCFLLDEEFNFDKGFAQFFHFKTERRELALINEKSARLLFGEEYKNKVPLLTAACINVVEDMLDPRFEALPYDQFDWVVCSIGRLNKRYIPTVIEGFKMFAEDHTDKRIVYIFVGDQPEGFAPNMREVIKNTLSGLSNVTVFQMGYVYPMPENFFGHIDVGVASAGSSRVLWNRNIPTISMDAKDGQPIGILGYTTINTLYRDQEERQSLQKLLSLVLVDNWTDGQPYTPYEIQEYDEYLKEHMIFISHMAEEQEYYDVLGVQFQDLSNKVKRFVISKFGLKNYKTLKKLITRKG